MNESVLTMAFHCGREFSSCERGTVAIIGALSAVVLCAVLGLAIDYGQMVSIRQQAQSALDAAVLAGSNPMIADEQRRPTFAATFTAGYGQNRRQPSLLEFSFDKTSGGMARAEFSFDTSFLSMIGEDNVKIAVNSSARLDVADLEIVFALDISGSMQATDMGGGTRLEALKTSVKQLIDVIKRNQVSGQQVRFGIVPFNMAVNIGTANGGFVQNTGHSLFAGSTWGGCVLERRGGFQSKDVYNAGASDGSGRWPAYIWPPAPNSSTACTNRSNGTNASYSSIEAAPLGLNPWVGGPNFNCPRYPLRRLSTSDSAIRGAIDELTAFGNVGTTVGPAVGWALRLLSPDGPFKDGAAFSANTRKVLIVVTDGEMVTDGGTGCSGATNTSTPYEFDPESLGLMGRKLTSGPTNDSFTPYGYLLDSDPYNSGLSTALSADQELDRLSIDACKEARNRKTGEGAIHVYAIAASTGASPASRAGTVLSQCASDADSFIYAEDSVRLEAAFKKISADLLKLRLTH